jgi:hypothetical protein
MARVATEPAYNLGWKRDERSLLVVSLGTGGAPVLGHEPSAPSRNVLSNVGATLSALITQAQFDQDINCRTIGRCTHGAKLDSEVRDFPVPVQRSHVFQHIDQSSTRADSSAAKGSGVPPGPYKGGALRPAEGRACKRAGMVIATRWSGQLGSR